MFFSRIQLDSTRTSLRDLARTGSEEGYRIHQAIWRLFSRSGSEQRDFLYRRDPRPGLPLFYTVSSREPDNTGGPWGIESKRYAPRLNSGDRLAFVLTVNPVVSRRDTENRQHRHDVVMDLKRTYSKKERPPMAHLAREAGLSWLAARAENLGFGFDRESVLVGGYRQHRLFKGKSKHPIRFSTLDIDGVITVTEPETFVEKALLRGIGPAKGFGCGLMLVRRV